MRADGLQHFFLDLFFPPRCPLCGRVLPPGKICCEACRERQKPQHWCSRMILPQSGKAFVCAAPDLYDGSLRSAMISFKFYGKKRHARFFAARMFDQLNANGLLDGISLVTSVPLSPQRRQRRGYNQSELIARELSALCGLPYSTVLEKQVENREQHRLNKADRRDNVRGVYRMAPGKSACGKILLIDDILTTGATLGECAGVLYAAGAQQVLCAAACRVPTR
jgi:ComF family protein